VANTDCVGSQQLHLEIGGIGGIDAMTGKRTEAGIDAIHGLASGKRSSNDIPGRSHSGRCGCVESHSRIAMGNIDDICGRQRPFGDHDVSHRRSLEPDP
jgi:hypothetical protein